MIHSVQSMAGTGAAQMRQTVFPMGTGLNGVFGFTLKADLGKPSVTVERFGNMQTDAATGQPVVRDFMEPPTEIAEDVAIFIITMEMPGIAINDIQVEVKNRTLIVTAEKPRRKYRKEVVLPPACSTEILQRTCQDGVFETRLAKV